MGWFIEGDVDRNVVESFPNLYKIVTFCPPWDFTWPLAAYDAGYEPKAGRASVKLVSAN